MVVLCSTPISLSVCRRLSSRAPGAAAYRFRRLRELRRSFLLAFSTDDPGAFLADRFRFLGDRALHLLRDVDILDFDGIDFDAPFERCLAQAAAAAGG